jgi:phytoene/squalene synthetase
MYPTQTNYLAILNRIPIEQIKDHPNILVAAGFWEEERYQAAKTCYAFMRKIDDLIDNFKASHSRISESQRGSFLRRVDEWILMARARNQTLPEQKAVNETIARFHIPEWTIDDFARSMVYDINHDGFSTLQAFLEYSRGATVAPSSIFVHLCGLRKSGDEWLDPLFDVRSAATPCAIFSYLVHIIRDFQKDQLNNLSYFGDDRILANDLNRGLMRQIAEGMVPTRGFRNLMAEYCQLADEYRQQTYRVLEQITPLIEPRYHLSLLIIFNLYLMVFERIDCERGTFTADELNPTSQEIYDRVYRTIHEFQYQSVNY